MIISHRSSGLANKRKILTVFGAECSALQHNQLNWTIFRVRDTELAKYTEHQPTFKM